MLNEEWWVCLRHTNQEHNIELKSAESNRSCNAAIRFGHNAHTECRYTLDTMGTQGRGEVGADGDALFTVKLTPANETHIGVLVLSQILQLDR